MEFVEDIKKFWATFECNADAVILNPQLHAGWSVFRGDDNFRLYSGRDKFGCVIEQSGDTLGKQGFVCRHPPQWLANVDVDLRRLKVRIRVKNTPHHRIEIDRRQGK